MKQRFRSILWSASVAALVLATQASAAEPTELVKVTNFGDVLVFDPIVEFDRMILTVTGPCDYQYRQVSTRREMVFKLDETTIDGVYRFNVMREEKIPGDIKELLYDARKNNDVEMPRKLCREGLLPEPPLSVAAGFRVFRGEIVYDPEAFEEGSNAPVPADVLGSASSNSGDGGLQSVSAADFVINDDLIVDGSACIGFDCVNGEVFSFDTIRLKENNLRIKFDDTSVAASFPSTDWQLTANASANGGASKFSIDDISGSRTPFTVEANARSHSLYVDDGGRIGSRTSTPSVEIHTIDGDTPTLRLQQDGSSGFAPQTWDVAGNETNFFIRDVTNGSQLPLRIRPDAPTSSIFVDVDGAVGMGTASPSEELHIRRTSGNAALRLETTAAPGGDWIVRSQTVGQLQFRNNAAGTIPFRLGSSAQANLLNIGVSADGTTDIADEIHITGSLFINGVDNSTPDYVFGDEYELESIEEHAEFMWREKHLPAVLAATTGEDGRAVINVSHRSQAVLEELEKAHIYIEQLHNRMQSEKAALEAELQQRDALLGQLAQRLQRLEVQLDG